jgi:hypothetical protein
VDALDQHVRRDDKAAFQHRRVVADPDHDSVACTGNLRDQSDQLVLW